MTEGWLEIDGVRWAYLEEGSGPLLLLFHGTLSYKEVFRSQIEGLSARRRVVAFDWPGHGDSGWDPSGWTVADLVDSLPRLIEGLGAESAVIGGVSQGGAISMRAAIRHPAWVEGVVTMSAGLDPVKPEAIELISSLGATLADGSEDERRAAATAFQAMVHAPGWCEGHPVDSEEELSRMLSHPRAAMRNVTAIPGTFDSIEEPAREIRCPALIVWGEADARAWWGPRMAQILPDARLVMLPDAGHHVTLDAPGRVTDSIAAFLEAL